MSMRRFQVFSGVLALGACLLLSALDCAAQSSGHVLDEARQAGRDAASLPMATEDYFHDMDGGVALIARRDQGPQHVGRLDRRQ